MSARWRWWVGGVVGGLAVGCGTPAPDGASSSSSSVEGVSFSGSVAGRTLDIKGASGVLVAAKDGSVEAMIVGIENRAGLCELFRGPYEWASTGFAITFLRKPLPGATLSVSFPPGTYAIGAPTKTAGSEVQLSASFYESDKTCTNLVPAASQKATGGTVTIVSVDLGVVTGSFDVAFGAEWVTGSFKIPLCPILWDDVIRKRTCEPAPA